MIGSTLGRHRAFADDDRRAAACHAGDVAFAAAQGGLYVTLPGMTKRILIVGVLVAAGALSMTVAASQQPAQPQGPRVIDIQKLKDNLYVLTTSTPGNAATFSGGNVAVFITDSGVTLVDTKLAGWGQAMLDKIKSVTNKPVTTIINTHTHGDHTGNNDLFGATVDIVAQENTKANMEKMDAFKAGKAQFLPKKTYKDKMTVGSGKDRTDLYQRFTADLAAHAQAAFKAGQSLAAAAAAFKVDKYPGYKNERVRTSIQAVYDELQK